MTGPTPLTARRAVLTAAAAGAVVAVGGCSRYGDTAASAAPAAPAAPATSEPDAAAPSSAAPSTQSPSSETAATSAAPKAAVPALAALDRIPVGGGLILADEGIVLSRPAEDRVVAFSVTCTHQGCAVSTVSTDTVDCPCHGSRFRLADGSVESGPARRPLERVEVELRDGQVTRR